MIKTLSLIKQMKSRLLASVFAVAIIGVAGVPAIVSATSSPKTASCSIAGVPSTATNGEDITPIITVTNNSSTPFSTTVSVTQSEISKAGSKGGAFDEPVQVKANSSVFFQGGTSEAQTGYRFKVVVKSLGKPHFSCSARSALVK